MKAVTKEQLLESARRGEELTMQFAEAAQGDIEALKAGKAAGNHTHTAAQVGARPSTWTPTAAEVGAVPSTRKVNNKALSADVTLSAADVGAAAASHGTHVSYSATAPKMDGTAAAGTASTVARSDHVHPTDTSRAAASHTHTASDVGAAAASHTHTPSSIGAAAASHGTHVSYSSTAPVMDGTASVGSASTVARSDHRHPTDTSRVPTTRKVNNKALSGDIILTAADVKALPISGGAVTRDNGISFSTGESKVQAAIVKSGDDGIWLGCANALPDAQSAVALGSIADPEYDYHAANKKYVDDAISSRSPLNHTHTAAEVGALASGGTAAAATKLATSRTIRTNLGSTSTASFNGTANITPGVTGTLGIANGGTGNASGRVTAGQKSGTTLGTNATAEGNIVTASGNYSHAEGLSTTTTGVASHAEGSQTTASESGSHAEGYSTTASGLYSHAEGGYTIASGNYSHAEGNNTTASGNYSHAEGNNTTASGDCSHAEGYSTKASASYQHAGGKFNVEYTSGSSRFIIGKGISSSSRANCFRITDTGTYAAGAYNASGADYAELFEWVDGNPENEDRAGLFVTLDGDKLRLAEPEDDYILGIVSGNPSIVGDVHDDQWAGMYLYDVFGRPLWGDVEVPDETMEEPDPENPGQTVTRVIIPAHTEHRQKLNPDYDGTKPYTARSQRPEWDAVGLMGKLVAVDDGTCQVNGYCTVGEGGAATASEARTKYRVMKRLDETHVQVMILP